MSNYSPTTKKIILAAFVLLGFMLLGVASTSAAVNQQMNYQGKLTDTSGAAVADGDYEIVFSLYTASSGGSNIWTETSTTTVTNGLFSVMLGSTTALTGVDFNQTLYLGVEVEGDGEMSPRKILGTVPAAFESLKLGGVASSSFLRSDADDTASGLLTFTGGLISNSSSTISQLNFDTATGTTLVINGDTITDFTGTGLSVSSGALTVSNLASSSLNVGGTYNPNYILQASSTAAGGFAWVATSTLGFVIGDDVTLAGENYLSISGQQITANAINPDNLAATDFGDFTCNGTTCSFDTNTVGVNELEVGIGLSNFTDDVGYLADITGESFLDLVDTITSFNANRVLYTDAGNVIDSASFTFNGTTLAVPTLDLTNALAGEEGGTGISSVTSNQLLIGATGNGNNWVQVATSSLGLRESLFTDAGATTYLTSLTDNLAIGTTTSRGLLTVGGDFYVGTSSIPTLKVDTGGEFVMIGRAAPRGSALLTVNGEIALGGNMIGNDGVGTGLSFNSSGASFTNTSASILSINLQNTSSGDSSGNRLVFESATSVEMASIESRVVTNTQNGSLSFNVRGSNSLNEVARFNQSGEFMIGTTTSRGLLTVDGNFFVGTSSLPALFVDASTDRVGIGTTTSSSLFSLEKNQNSSTDLRIQNYNTGSAAAAALRVYNDIGAQLGISMTGSNYSGYTNKGLITATALSDGLVIGTIGADPIDFATNLTTRLQIDDTGNVNVGTTTARGLLTVGGNFFVGTSSLAALFVDTVTDRVGVGTTTLENRFSVFETVDNPQVRVSYDATRYATFQVDSAGDMIIAASGGNIFFNDDNLFICTGGSCPGGNPTGNGNLFVENKIGVGTTTPEAPLDVWSGAGTKIAQFFSTGVDMLVGVLTFDSTPATDHSISGDTVSDIMASTTVAFGDVVYLNSVGAWALADATASTSVSHMMGIAAESGTNGSAVEVATGGAYVRDDSWSWTVGSPVYISTTAGDLTQTAPSGSGNVVRVVGVATGASVIKLEFGSIIVLN